MRKHKEGKTRVHYESWGHDDDKVLMCTKHVKDKINGVSHFVIRVDDTLCKKMAKADNWKLFNNQYIWKWLMMKVFNIWNYIYDIFRKYFWIYILSVYI